MTSKLKVNLINDSGDNNIITSDGSGNLTTQKILYPAFEAKLTSDQAISDNTLTKINFDTAELDTDSKYSTSDYRFTPTIAGKYFVYSNINGYSGGDSDLVTITQQIRKNGSIVRFSFVETSNNFGKTHSLSCSSILTLDSDDYVEIYASIDGNSNGGEVIQGTANSGTFFGAYRLGS